MIDTGDTFPITDRLDFTLPADLEADRPAEARGLARDQVRLMVTNPLDDTLTHTQFRRLPDFLHPGDVLVINTSGTLPAALLAKRADGSTLELHLSTHLPGDLWTVEARSLSEKGSKPFFGIEPGETLTLPSGATATLHLPYLHAAGDDRPVRLWLAALNLPGDLLPYLTEHGFPIRYGYVRESWPLNAYQTVYATEAGSAEMPSAGRAFTPELITECVARGIQFAPLLLHTGVASLESHEPPYEEFFRVPTDSARLINDARAHGRRIIAVGTTAIRALETVTEPDGVVHAGEGWTNLVITPARGIWAIDGLLTGLHEPRASHLMMLEALVGRAHLTIAYTEALREHYLWHEFGDLHLLLGSV